MGHVQTHRKVRPDWRQPLRPLSPLLLVAAGEEVETELDPSVAVPPLLRLQLRPSLVERDPGGGVWEEEWEVTGKGRVAHEVLELFLGRLPD